MKKNILKVFSVFLLTMSRSWSMEGIVLVLEAPLLKEPNMGSKVLQVLRKGSKVYVPNEIGRSQIFPEFIQTYDRTGREAFIPSKYVKIITGLPNEARQAINYEGHDPTDYRLEEPIPPSYPFPNNEFVRASFSYHQASNANAAYKYGENFNEQKYGSESGARVTVMKKVSYDKNNRFYFGIMGAIASATNDISFAKSFSATAHETRNVFKVGPWFTYDAYKSAKYQINIGSGFTFNYHMSKLTLSFDEFSDGRSFSGYSISPMLSTGFQILDVVPYMDVIGGADASLYLPHTLKAKGESQYPDLWSENQIRSNLKTQLSLFLGLQFKY
ncbi:MAG: hypothetical protein K2Q18_13705 [Bdellovibrionales bacterium]|nr:hypothetical protein [Bdellovibrionales bacterium]